MPRQWFSLTAGKSMPAKSSPWPFGSLVVWRTINLEAKTSRQEAVNNGLKMAPFWKSIEVYVYVNHSYCKATLLESEMKKRRSEGWIQYRSGAHSNFNKSDSATVTQFDSKISSISMWSNHLRERMESGLEGQRFVCNVCADCCFDGIRVAHAAVHATVILERSRRECGKQSRSEGAAFLPFIKEANITVSFLDIQSKGSPRTWNAKLFVSGWLNRNKRV